jgi:hypothetical protein
MNKKPIPADALVFSCPCTFAAEQAAEGKPRTVRLTAYDGGIHPHFWWENLAFDLAGVKMAKPNSPVLYQHDVNQRLGVIASSSFDKAAVFEGTLLDNATAAQVIADAEAGFPFEASWRFDPDKSEFRRLQKGETAQVNGRTLKGPATLFTKTIIQEVSVVVFGAIRNAKAEVFEKTFDERNHIMTPEQLKQDHPDCHAAVFAAGQAAGEKLQTDRFAAVRTACGEDAALACECFAAGMDKAASLEKRNATLAEAVASRDRQIAELSAQKPAASQPASTTTVAKVDPAAAEFSDDAAKNSQAGQPAQTAPADISKTSLTAMSGEQLKNVFAQRADLKAEFSSEKSFLTYVDGLRKGTVKL